MFEFLKSFYKKKDGVTAIEFSFFAIPFAFLMIGMVEVGMLSTAGTLLQGATDDAARLIRTGQAQTSGDPRGAFEDLLCDKVSLFISCPDLTYESITIDESVAGFSDIANDITFIEPIFNIDGEFQAAGFDPGNENSLVVIRVAYNYPLFTPFVGPFLSDGSDNTKLLLATAIIQNEPYAF